MVQFAAHPSICHHPARREQTIVVEITENTPADRRLRKVGDILRGKPTRLAAARCLWQGRRGLGGASIHLAAGCALRGSSRERCGPPLPRAGGTLPLPVMGATPPSAEQATT